MTLIPADFTPLDPGLNHVPGTVARVHLMGICGTAMAALAALLSGQGIEVRGSDAGAYPPVSDFLSAREIPVFDGYGAGNLAWGPDLVVVGNVIRRDNPEVLALAMAKTPFVSMPTALSHFFVADAVSLVVCGTHGKTTTASILASALDHAGLDPGFMIGGIVRGFEANYRLGAGPHRVLEGDEYDTAFFDKGPKFPHYRPQMAILTSVEFDHADIFADFAAVRAVFSRLAVIIPPDGILVVNHDDAAAVEIASRAGGEVISYGFGAGADWRITGICPTPAGMTFVLCGPDREIPLTVPMPGAYNAANAAAVAVLLVRLGLDDGEIAAGIAAFAGVKRRQEVRGEENGIMVIDDFAHHPTAVAATLAGLREHYPGRRLIAVFEARSNTSRRRLFQSRFVAAFDAADLVCVREPEPLRGIATDELFSAADLVCDLKRRGIAACYFDSPAAIVAFLRTGAVAGDVIAVLSNGGFDDIHAHILSMLRRR